MKMMVNSSKTTGSTPATGQPRKSHTCGSLYANCNCAEVVPSVTNPLIRHSQDDNRKNCGNNGGSTQVKSDKRLQSLAHPDIPTKAYNGSTSSNNLRGSSCKRCPSTFVCDGQKVNRYWSNFGIAHHQSLKDMGSGVSSSTTAFVKSSINTGNDHLQLSVGEGGVPLEDYEYLKTIVGRLKEELTDMEQKFEHSQQELITVRRSLNGKQMQIGQMQREIHKLKSVLQQTVSKSSDLLATLQEKHAMANNTAVTAKKQGVSAQSAITLNSGPIPKYEKDFRSKQLIKEALTDNDFLNKLGTCQIREMIECMYLKLLPAGEYVIREGGAGAHLYVSDEGEFEVIKDGKVLGKMGPGKAFGELAILYNCTRTASIRVIIKSKVWVLDRNVFQQIMMRTGLQQLQDNLSFLRSVPFLHNLNDDALVKIADALEAEFYSPGKYIIRQGSSGDRFFIIRSGMVRVSQRLPDRLEDEERRILRRSDYFGEQALLRDDTRSASVIALDPGVECLTLDREAFKNLIGDLNEIKDRDYGDQLHAVATFGQQKSASNDHLQLEFSDISLNDLVVVGTLGIGGFGRVELVQYVHEPQMVFALKCLKKQHIVDTQQQDHVQNERSIMLSCHSPFICRLYRTYRDAKYVYMLLEACQGGEVWTILRDTGCFDDYTAKFIIACVVDAFDYLHTRGIIYRDLKPENLLLDANGYVKLVDFGFSKKLEHGCKTWTFCGTPEYVAPETILNKGHDRAVDYWALGVLMYELLTGSPPFTANDPMKTYNQILKGAETIDFFKHGINIGRAAENLIKRLCKTSPSDRLGYQFGGIRDIKKHKWFDGFDWTGLINRTLPPPINCSVSGPCDISNFDCFEKDSYVPPDEFSNWDKDF